MYYVYIIHSKSLNKKYTGYCSDLKSRIEQHNGNGTRFTSRASDWRLVYYEGFIDKSDAIREEKFLKTGKGNERVKYLLESYFNKID